MSPELGPEAHTGLEINGTRLVHELMLLFLGHCVEVTPMILAIISGGLT